MAIAGPLFSILAMLGMLAYALQTIFGRTQIEEAIYGFWVHLAFFGICSLQSIGWDGAAILLAILPLVYAGTKTGSLFCRFAFIGIPPFPNVICLILIFLGMWTSLWSARLYWVIAIGIIWAGIVVCHKKIMHKEKTTEERRISTICLLFISLYPDIIFHSIQSITPTFLHDYWFIFQRLFGGEFPTWI